MAAYTLKTKSPWQKVPLGGEFEDDQAFAVFGGLEVLEDYDLVKSSEVSYLGNEAD